MPVFKNAAQRLTWLESSALISHWLAVPVLCGFGFRFDRSTHILVVVPQELVKPEAGFDPLVDTIGSESAIYRPVDDLKKRIRPLLAEGVECQPFLVSHHRVETLFFPPAFEMGNYGRYPFIEFGFPPRLVSVGIGIN
jgi:hypothetical protein